MHNSTEQTKVGMFNVAEGDNRASDLTGKGLIENDLAGKRNQGAIDSGARNALAGYGVISDLNTAYGTQGDRIMRTALGVQAGANDTARTIIQGNLNDNALQSQPVQQQAASDAFNEYAGLLSKKSGGILSPFTDLLFGS
jgi:hypothetical protein